MKIIVIPKIKRKSKFEAETYQLDYTFYLRKITDAGSHYVIYLDVEEKIIANRLSAGWQCECKKFNRLDRKSCSKCGAIRSRKYVLIKQKIKMFNIFRMRCNYAKNNKKNEKSKKNKRKRDSSVDFQNGQ